MFDCVKDNHIHPTPMPLLVLTHQELQVFEEEQENLQLHEYEVHHQNFVVRQFLQEHEHE